MTINPSELITKPGLESYEIHDRTMSFWKTDRRFRNKILKMLFWRILSQFTSTQRLNQRSRRDNFLMIEHKEARVFLNEYRTNIGLDDCYATNVIEVVQNLPISLFLGCASLIAKLSPKNAHFK